MGWENKHVCQQNNASSFPLALAGTGENVRIALIRGGISIKVEAEYDEDTV